MKGILVLFWIVTMGATALAGLLLLETIASAESAPQQAAGAALAAAVAVVPYVFSRAAQGIWTALQR